MPMNVCRPFIRPYSCVRRCAEGDSLRWTLDKMLGRRNPQEFQMNAVPRNLEELDELLSRPTDPLLESIRQLAGDVIVLGVAGKMGPTLARMARWAFDAVGCPNRVIGVARFSDSDTEKQLQKIGVETIRCNLLDRESVAKLPNSPNVIYMAGQKFGTTDAPERTWAMNTLVPAIVAERFARSRIVAFSTGCVYPSVQIHSESPREGDPVEPRGEYGNSCVGRERIFEHFAKLHATPLALLRLNYAIDLRYGVLTDIALKVWNGESIDLSTGYVNVIWQGDACNIALQCLAAAAIPPLVLNIAGPESASVRAIAGRFGEIMGRIPVLTGKEADTALLSNAGRMMEM